MSIKSLSTYNFKPFEFAVAGLEAIEFEQFSSIVGCNDEYYFAYKKDINAESTRSLWKCSFDSGQKRMIPCKDIPSYQLTFKTSILSGNTLIEIGFNTDHFRALNKNLIYIGNLADEYKERGMKFKEFVVSGDIPLPNKSNSALMIDGKHIYSVAYEFVEQNKLNVHRLDLDTRKWELLYKTNVVGSDTVIKYIDELIFYKCEIYMFATVEEHAISIDVSPKFMKIYKFDVVNKKWELIPINPESWPQYEDERFWHGCVQYPEKSNLVYLFGGSLGGIWRFDMDNLRWEKLKWKMPDVFDMFSFVTPSGRMCCYGVHVNDGTRECEKMLISAWFSIPKLKIIAWEAMIHYFKEPMFASSNEYLKEIGLPKEFYERIIEARRTNRS